MNKNKNVKYYFSSQSQQRFKVFLLWLIFFLYGIGNVISYNCALSLLLQRVGVEQLPILLLLSAMLVIMITRVFTPLADKTRPDILLIKASLSILIISALFVGGIYYFKTSLLIMAFYVLSITAGALFSIMIHALIDQSFLPLEAKVKVPLISSGMSAGTVTGGVLLFVLAQWINTLTILLVWLGLLALQFVLLIMKMQYINWQLTHPINSEAMNAQVSPDVNRIQYKIPVIKILTVIGLCAGFSEVLVGYVFAEISASTYTDENELTAFLGWANSVFYMVITIVNIVVLPRILKNWGLLPGLATHAIVHAIGFLASFISPTILVAALFRGSNKVTRFTFFASATSLFCSFLPKSLQMRVRGTFNGIIFPIGFSLGSLFLMIFQASLSIQLIAFVGFCSTIPWLIALLSIRKHLFEYLTKNLNDSNEKTVINAIQGIASLGHVNNADKVLCDYLKDCKNIDLRKNVVVSLGRYNTDMAINTLIDSFDLKQEKLQLATLESLSGFSDHRVTYAMLQFLRKGKFTSFNVRVHLIFVLTNIVGKSIAPYLMEYLEDPDDRVRANTIEALGHLEDKNLIRIISPYLNDQYNRIKANAMIALYPFRKMHQTVQKELEGMLHHSSKNMICSGLYAVGEIKLKRFLPVVMTKLQDPDLDIEVNAAFALIKMHHPEGIAALIRYLNAGQFELVMRIVNVLPRLSEKIRYDLLTTITHSLDFDKIKLVLKALEKANYDFETEKHFINVYLKEFEK